MKKPLRFITKNIFLLSLVSFLTDIASEAIYPILPLFISQLGYGVVTIGVIEGVADLIAGMSKLFFAYWSDATRNRSLFVQVGYGVSALAKPVMGMFPVVGVIFAARFVDRFGKGVRTAARDAILIEESVPEVRGRVFGFHRAFDTFGAMLGPLCALLFLYVYPGQYAQLFTWTLIPGLIALLLTLLLRSKNVFTKRDTDRSHVSWVRGFWQYWKSSSSSYKKLLLGLLLFTFVNSTDMFLILRARELVGSDVAVVGLYIFFNLIGTIGAYAAGVLSDRYGYRPVYVVGLLLFAVVYSAMAYGVTSIIGLGLVFMVYGVFSAMQESVPKAWLSLHFPQEYKATAMGLYLALSSVCFLAGSVLSGILWQYVSASVMFNVAALGAVGVIGYFVFIRIPDTSRAA